MAPKSKEQRLFGAACLKLKLSSQSGTTSLYESLLEDLELSDEEVEAYLAEHRDVVQAALDAHGRPKN